MELLPLILAEGNFLCRGGFNKVMKKFQTIAAALLAVCLAGVLLAGCAGSSSGAASPSGSAGSDSGSDSDSLRVVTTIFPIYDWTRQVLGDVPGVELVWLQDTGVDMHSYQPSAEDMLKLSSCDLFVYVGGTSDSWVDGALKEAVNPDMKVLSLLEILGDNARLEELTEGMQAEDHEGHDHGDEDEDEYDEHVWLSLKNASLLTGSIADALSQLDPDHAGTYAANAAGLPRLFGRDRGQL